MMDKNERLVLRNYLQCFESRKKGHKPRSLVLLDLLEKYPEDEKVISLLKKKVPNKDARRMIVSRLREKMLNSLILDVNLDRGEVYDELGRSLANVIKEKFIGRVLFARGQRDLGFFVLERSIQMAKKYEFYDDLVDMLGLERQFMKVWKGSDDAYYNVDAEIQKYAKCRDSVRLAKKYYQEIIIKFGFKGLSRAAPDKGKLGFLKKGMEELSIAFEETGSATVGYYYYYLLIEYNQTQNNLEEASVNLNRLSQMLEDNPSIRKKSWLTSVYVNLGANELWMHHFSEARKFFSRSLEYARVNSRNHGVITEFMFYAQFYSGQLGLAQKTLESLVDNKYLDQSDFRKSVRNYLLACVVFTTKDYRESLKYLGRSQAIGKDKEGWNIGSRILSILLALEQQDFDYADSLIINFRQFVRVGLKGIEVRKRDKMILEILLELRKKSYNFIEVKESKMTVLHHLACNSVDAGWALQSPEIICFHTWFSDKLNGRDYQPNYSKQHIYSEEE